MKAYQLHDTETEDILGSVIVTKQISSENSDDELREGWDDFNKLEEHELNSQDVSQFVKWFNENYVTQIRELDLDFIQP